MNTVSLVGEIRGFFISVLPLCVAECVRVFLLPIVYQTDHLLKREERKHVELPIKEARRVKTSRR